VNPVWVQSALSVLGGVTLLAREIARIDPEEIKKDEQEK
jgi:hypothetical protein